MRIVLAWELGANWGHARRLESLARAMTARGHEVHLVVQDLGAFDARSLRLWQAPVWSGLLRYSATRALGPPQRYGDLLANLGLQDAQAIAGLLRGWEALIEAIRPDALVADFAPAALLASRGRLPRLATGTGFTVPPAHLDHFPPFPGATPAPLVSEASLLSLINQALEALDRPQLSHLTDLAGAEALMPAVFAELDPYRIHRQGPPISPFLSAPLPALPEACDGIFAYLPGRDLTAAGVDLLCRLGAQVTAVMPGLDPKRRAILAGAGVRLAERALRWDEIARHGAVLCNGGMGTVAQALATGLPLAVLPAGIEQDLTARALEASGLSIPPEALTSPEALAQARPRARDLSLDFRRRLKNPALLVTEALEALVNGADCG